MNTTLVWGLFSALGIAGCATSGGVVGGAGRAVSAASPATATVETSGSSCRATAPAAVVASHVYVPAGVAVSMEEGRATLRFAHHKAECAVARALLGSDRFVTDEGTTDCVGERRDDVATSGTGSTVHAVLSLFGFAVGDREHVLGHAFAQPEESRGAASDPGLVPLAGERFLRVWVDGNSEGRTLRAQPFAGQGTPSAPAIELSPSDVSVIGRPSAVVAPDGRGVVAFLASGSDGFNVFVTPIACEVR